MNIKFMSKWAVKRGDLVEFTSEDVDVHEIGGENSLYGVVVDARRDGVVVEMANGRQCCTSNIQAQGWSGWVPDGLEEVLDKYRPEIDEYY
jgi:hypothetical protein